MSSGKCIHLCNSHPDQGYISIMQESTLVPPCSQLLLLFPPPSNTINHCSDFYQYQLVLPILLLHINIIIEYVLVCVWLLLLNIMSLRFIHVVPCISNSFIFIADCYSILWIYCIYPVFCQWMLRLLPYVGKQCCFEHWGTCVFSSQHFCFFQIHM